MTRCARGTIEAPGVKVAQKSGLNRSILGAGWGVGSCPLILDT
jgi:putative transposase